MLRDREYVIVNIDETVVRHEYQGPSGNGVAAPRQGMRAANLFFQRTNGAQEEAGTTLVAMMYDHNQLQRHLPQIWLPKDSARNPLSEDIAVDTV